MKTTSKYIIRPLRQTAIFCLLALGVCGCVKEDYRSGGDPTDTEEADVKFEINIPEADIPQTRAMGIKDEYSVLTIDVLAFDGDDFLYRVQTTFFNQALNKHFFTVKLKKSKTPVRFVFLANATEIIDECYPGGVIPVGETFADLQSKLIKKRGEKWTALGTHNYIPIPMWGESRFPVTGSDMTVPTIDMHRMLARINVYSQAQDFTWTNLYLVNPMGQGYVIPTSAGWDEENDIAKDPSLGTGASWKRLTGDLIGEEYYTYEYPVSAAEANNEGIIQQCQREIYVFETSTGDKNVVDNNTFLIVKGRYKGTDGYYRLDIADKETGQYLPLLRNHTYDFYIHSVNIAGFPSMKEAIDYGPANIDAGLVVENDYEYRYFAWDNQYHIALEDKKYNTDWRAKDDIKFKVKTNYEGGWKAVVSSEPDDPTATNPGWITFGPSSDPTPTGSGGTGKTNMVFNIAENLTAGDRVAYIHVSWATTYAVIEVKQSKGDYTLAVTPPTITVGNTAGDHEVIVETTYDYGWTATVVGENSTWLTIDPTTNSGTKDQQQLKFKVAANPNPLSRSAQIHVTAGRLNEVVTVTQNETYYMEIDKSAFNFAWNDISDKSFTATTNYPGTWKIYVSSSETAINPVSDFINPQWTGTDLSGNQTIKFWNEYHISSGQRKAYIHILYGDEKKVIPITQNDGFSLSNCTLAYPEYTYIGAFWKHNQTGERLIRIAHQSGMDGGWIAFVPDETTWVKLDNEKSSDAGVTYASDESPKDMNTYDSQYQVSGNNKSSRTGKLASGGYIEFRAGLTGTLASAETAPRYGTIILLYNNCTKYQVLYVRQGEAADYLMRKTDTGGNGESWGSPYPRPDAVKWSPYNLTAANFKNESTTPYPVGVRGAHFTDYPTQAGAFFQWADNSPTTAYPPIGSVSINTTGLPNDHWNSLSASHETCPSPYRRPNDGTTSGFTSQEIIGSEMRQSIYFNPSTGNTAVIDDNTLWGYYADGFFDRYEITSSLNTILPWPNSTVAASSMKVAYIGSLFYNPNNSASLFMPAAGRRSNSLSENGFTGHYWSSSRTSSKIPVSMFSRSNSTNQYIGSFIYHHRSIRCVRD